MAEKKKKKKSPTVYKEIQRELEDSSIIYKLGGEPIYVHTTPANAKVGLKTAEKDITTALGEAEDTAKAELEEQLKYLQAKRKAGETKLGGASQFKALMQNVFLNDKLDLKQKITNLLELKSTITAFSSLQAYKKEHPDNQNIDKLTLKINSKNIVVNATDTDSLEKSLKIKMADLIKGLDSQSFNNIARKHIDKLLETLSKDKGPSRVTKFNNKEMSADIGWIFEAVFNNTRYPCGEIEVQKGKKISIELGFKNLSAKLQKDNKDTGYAGQLYDKSDTIICFYKAGTNDVIFSFSTSDKTGIEGRIKDTSKDIAKTFVYANTFTSSVSEPFSLNSKEKSRVIGGGITHDNYSVNFTNAARYAIANIDVLSKDLGVGGLNKTRIKSEIAATIMWSAALVEVTGILNPKGSKRSTRLPLFIRHYDKLYYTEDILKRIKEVKGLDIIKSEFVVRKYLEDWISGKNNKSIDQLTLIKLIHRKQMYIGNVYLSRMGGSKERVSYLGLLKDQQVSDALETIYDTIKDNLRLNIRMRIKLNNYEPLF